MDFNGLSLDQAPPISAPLRFFITAPVFGFFAALFLFFSDPAVLVNRFSIEAIVATHLITIGIFGFVMMGALTQMLPVLAGAKIFAVKRSALVGYLLLLFGVVSMVFGLMLNSSIVLWIAVGLLGSGFFLLISLMLFAIKGVTYFTPSIFGMMVSLFFAFSIVGMGLYLLYGYASGDMSSFHVLIANIHSVWAVFGFCGILIVGVAFQVLPMFYVAPKFKQFFEQRVVLLIGFGLLLWSVLILFVPKYLLFAKLWVATLFFAFAITVWFNLNKRKRSISDITIWYWRSAVLFLLSGTVVWIFASFYEGVSITLVALLIGGGFIMSVMQGMLYKIVPFLVWFHLNALGYMTIPTMNEMINKKVARVQFMLFITALFLFVVSFFVPWIFKVAALTFMISMAILEYNLFLAARIYRRTKKSKPDFDMSAFTTQ